jgi:DNA invertase Pin-like site-specific DNA recombinase
MTEHPKIKPSHLARTAVIYVRQSTLAQVERNTESTRRQYDLTGRAAGLGWPHSAIRLIDADQGVSGSVTGRRGGFENLVAEVALGQVGIIIALEVSRLARDNAAWYRLLDLAGVCDTLVADTDTVYHPALFDDRLLLGMKGIMSEAELQVLRARLDGGIRSKAARGELRRGLPVGLVYGEEDGQVLHHPDEQVQALIAAVFTQFEVLGSARAVWLWLKDQGMAWPMQRTLCIPGKIPEITWVTPAYPAVHSMLTHPAYAGAYVYGRSKAQRHLAADGTLKTRLRRLPPDQWQVLLPGHHQGYISWEAYQANQQRLAANIRPRRHQPGTGAVREGCALLQGLATCGECGRKLAVYYEGKHKATPGYYCTGTGKLVEGRGTRHLRVGGVAIDAAVADAFLAALQPDALHACLAAAEQLEAGHDAVIAQHRRQAEQARYAAARAERRYRAVDPENRLVARSLETEWNAALAELASAETELTRRQAARPAALTDAERHKIMALGDDLHQVWDAPTTTDKDRKQLLRTLLGEISITVHRDETDGRADLVLHWKGGAVSDLSVPLKRKPRNRLRTSEHTIDLIRRLAVHYPDATIAHVLNRQHRTTARGLSFTASRVASLRTHWHIPGHQPSSQPDEGELLNVTQAARELGIAPSTLLRWLNDGFVAGEQLTPGAPWRIRLTSDLRGMLAANTPDGWVPLGYATQVLGVSRQTLLQKVKRGELRAVLIRTGRRKGLRIELPTPQDRLF